MTTSQSRQLEPGSYVQAFCTRCKEQLRHTVVALVEGVPVRVQCNTCGGEHVYRRSEPAAARRAAGERRPAAPKRPAAAAGMEAEWAKQVDAAGARERRRYAVTQPFRAQDVLEHPLFGVGIVQRVLEPGKILVLFQAGPKTLVCGGAER